MTITIQLFDSNIDLGMIIIVIDESFVNGTETSLADQKGSAEATCRDFKVGEGEEAKVIGSALREVFMKTERVREVS